MERQQRLTDQALLNRGAVRAGTALVGAGALLSVTGAAVNVAAFVAALRRYVRNSNMPPSELAMHHWRRTKSAAQAGADSWRVHVPEQRTHQEAGARMPAR